MPGLGSVSFRRLAPAAALVVTAALLGLAAPEARAQAWGGPEDDWSAGSPSGATTGPGPNTPWSFRAGLGFTADPNDFLLNFDLGYAFDRFVTVGPMMQVGVEDDRFLVAPTANLTITIPDLPGERLDRFHPFVFVGAGFAILENDDRGGDTRQTGFLVNTGWGLDYQLSDRVSVGSRMILNFLPSRTLDDEFFFTWEVGSIKLAF